MGLRELPRTWILSHLEHGGGGNRGPREWWQWATRVLAMGGDPVGVSQRIVLVVIDC